MQCMSCGAALAPGTQFCELCGTGVPGAASTAASGIPVGGAPTRPQGGSPNAPYTATGAVPRVDAYASEPTAYHTPMPAPMAAPMASSPPPSEKSGSGWIWFGVGGGAAVIVALIVALVLVISGNKSNNTATATTIASVADMSSGTEAAVTEAATTEPPTTEDPQAAEVPLMTRMEGLFKDSQTGRKLLTDFTNATYAGNQCTDPDTAASMIAAVQANRDQRAAEAAQLQQDARGTDVAPIVNDFVTAMDASKQIDSTLSTWVADYWTDYADYVCDGAPPNPNDIYTDYATGNTAAGNAKTSAVSGFNALAKRLNASENTSFRTDWDRADI